MQTLPPLTEEDLLYPESDGKPLGESTLQLHWIMMLYTNLVDLFSDRPNVFIASDLFWYPVEGQPEVVAAPDVMVAFDRPAGHRRSYRQWREDDVPPAVVFEVQSHTNSRTELEEKFEFYQEHRVREYYLYDPIPGDLTGYRRRGRRLVQIRTMHDFQSPMLGIRFDLSDLELRVIRPDGEAFVTISELRQRGLRAQEEYLRQVAEERFRTEALAARLRELGVDPDSILGN